MNYKLWCLHSTLEIDQYIFNEFYKSYIPQGPGALADKFIYLDSEQATILTLIFPNIVILKHEV